MTDRLRRAYRRWADGDGWGRVLEVVLALVLAALAVLLAATVDVLVRIG